MNRLEVMRVGRRADLYGFSLDFLVPKRVDRGLTRSQMARLCGVHPSTIKRLEEGTIGPKDYASAMVYAEHYGLSQAEKAQWLSILFGIKRVFSVPSIGGILIPELQWMDTRLTDEFKKYFRFDGPRVVFRDGRSIDAIANSLWKQLDPRFRPSPYRSSYALMTHMLSVMTGNEALPKEQVGAYCQALRLSPDERLDFKLAAARDIFRTDPSDLYAGAAVGVHTDWLLAHLDNEERKAFESRFITLRVKARSLAGAPQVRLLKDGR